MCSLCNSPEHRVQRPAGKDWFALQKRTLFYSSQIHFSFKEAQMGKAGVQGIETKMFSSTWSNFATSKKTDEVGEVEGQNRMVKDPGNKKKNRRNSNYFFHYSSKLICNNYIELT